MSGDLRSILRAAQLPTSGISGLIFEVHAEAFLYQLYQHRPEGGWDQPIPQLNVGNNGVTCREGSEHQLPPETLIHFVVLLSSGLNETFFPEIFLVKFCN